MTRLGRLTNRNALYAASSGEQRRRKTCGSLRRPRIDTRRLIAFSSKAQRAFVAQQQTLGRLYVHIRASLTRIAADVCANSKRHLSLQSTHGSQKLAFGWNRFTAISAAIGSAILATFAALIWLLLPGAGADNVVLAPSTRDLRHIPVSFTSTTVLAMPVQTVFARNESPQPERTTFSRRFGATGDPAPSHNEGAQAALYEEAPGEPSGGKRYDGSTSWRVAEQDPGADPAISGKIEIPGHIDLEWSMRPNPDARIPASHFIEVKFKTTSAASDDPIRALNGIVLKDQQEVAGTPLRLQITKVSDHYFLILLSADEADRKRNLALLTQHNWIDLPVVYASGKRAIITFEKGTFGEELFRQALQKWNHVTPTSEINSRAGNKAADRTLASDPGILRRPLRNRSHAQPPDSTIARQ
jgi:hypothetical protein